MDQRALVRRAWSVVAVGAVGLLAVGLVALRGIEERSLPLVLLVLLVVLVPLVCMPPLRTGPEGRPAVEIWAPGTVVAGWYAAYVVVPAAYVVLGLDLAPNWVHAQVPRAPLVVQTLLLALVGLVAFGIGYRLPRAAPAARGPGGREGAPPDLHLLSIALILLVVGGLFKVAHLSAVGGFSGDLFANLSPTLREELDLRFGGVPYFLSMLFDAGALLMVFRAVALGRSRLLAALLIGLGITLAFLLEGKRSAVVPFLLFPIIWHHYLRRRLRVMEGVLLIAAGGVLMAALLFGRVLAPTVFTRGVGAVRDLGALAEAPVRFFLNSPELNEFDMTALAIQRRPDILRQIGGPTRGFMKYNFEALTYVVPRVIWKEKPVLQDLGQVFYQDLVAGPETVGFGVGLLGALYLFLGPIGVFVGMAVFGIATRATYEWLRPGPGHATRVYFYAFIFWDMFMLLRFGTAGFAILFVLQFQLASLAAMLLVAAGPPVLRIAPR